MGQEVESSPSVTEINECSNVTFAFVLHRVEAEFFIHRKTSAVFFIVKLLNPLKYVK